MMECTLRQQDPSTSMRFVAQSRTHQWTLDSAERLMGGTDAGPSPKELLLSAIMGCSAMDVVALAKKNKLQWAGFQVSIKTEQTSTQPKIFQPLTMVFSVRGLTRANALADPSANAAAAAPAGTQAVLEEPSATLLKCVELSLTRYCGVSAMVVDRVPIAYEVRVDDQVVGTGKAAFSFA